MRLFSEEEMKEALKEFPAFAEERFGNGDHR